MKKCCSCKIDKSLQEFHNNTSKSDGLNSMCIVCMKEYHKKYRKTKRCKLYHQKYRKSAKGMSIHKRHQQSDKGKMVYRQACSRRRERKLNIDINIVQYEMIYQKFNRQCFNCKTRNKLEVDHHYPLSKGYGLSLVNAVLLCRSCNASKGNHMPEEFYTEEKLSQLKEILK